MSFCMQSFYFSIKLLKSGFVANVKWREEPGFGMLPISKETYLETMRSHLLCISLGYTTY